MGGRGASSGGRRLKDGAYLPYGSEYKSVYQSGNIKFLVPTNGQVKAPLETMTKGRIYVTIGSDGDPRYISYHDKHNKKNKQIDIKGIAHTINGKRELPHTHKGYYHNEKGDFVLSTKERKMVDRVLKTWYNQNSK